MARLHCDSLQDKVTPKAIQIALQNLGSGDQALDKAYDDAVARIRGQQLGFSDLAFKVLQWIICARRPLHVAELQHAVALDDVGLEIDVDDLVEPSDLVSYCAGLVVLDQQSHIVRLVHYTTQQYFEQRGLEFFPHAQLEIASNCIKYISMQDPDCSETEEDFATRLPEAPFLQYATEEWGFHAQTVQVEVCSQALALLRDPSCLSWIAQILWSENGLLGSAVTDDWSTSGLHICAYFNLNILVERLLEGNIDINIRDYDGWTAVSCACFFGSTAVVEVMLRYDGLELNSQDHFGEIALWKASYMGHEQIVRLLLNRKDIDLNFLDKTLGTPLACASAEGHEAIVELFIQHQNTKVNLQDSNGHTPLINGVRNGHIGVVRLLLAKADVDANLSDYANMSPLFHAAEADFREVVQLLLGRKDLEVNVVDNGGCTALTHSLLAQHLQIANMLLKDPRTDPNIGRIDPVHETIWETSHEGLGIFKIPSSPRPEKQVVRAAFEEPQVFAKTIRSAVHVKPNAINSKGLSALHWAAFNGNYKVASMLLRNARTNVNLKNEQGFTPIWVAVQTHHWVVAELLLEHPGAVLEVPNLDGEDILDLVHREGLWTENIRCIEFGRRYREKMYHIERTGVDWYEEALD